ncbi:Transcriptional regulatory protein [Yarrowia sp. C11]|nr:Transcriptional regulatory protein [Yarrowia sp. E02]KAG5371540.1 Transcriptional regulatory protein [Yarrowia sp. C11]
MPPKKPDPGVRKTRSKTGCLTCRRRRVKCDEARPTCLNCIKAGRKCDYNMRLSFRSGLSSKLMQQIGKTEVGEQVMDFSDTDTLRFASDGGTGTVQQPPLYVNFPVKEESRCESRFDGVERFKVVKKEDLEHEWRVETGREQGGQSDEVLSGLSGEVLSVSPLGHVEQVHSEHTQSGQVEHLQSDHLQSGQVEQVQSGQSEQVQSGHLHPEQVQSISPLPDHPTHSSPSCPTFASYPPKTVEPQTSHSRDISLYLPSATESPLSNPIAIFLLREYVYKHGQGISCYDRYNVSPASIFDDVNHHSLRGMSNFWTFDVPLAALTCDFLLHAVLAWSALNHSMFSPEDSHFKLLGMEHYHTSITLLSSEIRMDTYKHNPMPAAATCLILAFFETYCGDLGNWFRHMTGAHEIIRETSLSELSHIGQVDSVFGLQQLELLYSYLRMDIMHSIVGGTGTFAPWQFWASVPSRVASNPAVYANDEILKVFARICFYIEEENVRKRGQTVHASNERFNESLSKWNELKDIVAQFRSTFGGLLAPQPLRGPPQVTPFGPKTNRASYHHDLVAAFLATAEILLHRIDPNVPVMGFAAIPFTAKACIEPMLEVIRSLPVSPRSFMMSDIYTTDQTGICLSHGEKLQILCSFTVPFFLASVQVMEPGQQEFVAGWFEDMFQSTGFKTALIIKNSLFRGWSDARKKMAARSASASPASVSESPESAVSPESSTSSVTDGKPRIRLDNGMLVGYDGKPVDSVSDPANRVRFAHGVLGDTAEMMQKLKLSESESDGLSPQP